MKRLEQIASLSGQIETITAMDWRKMPGEILDQVILGKTYLVTRRGRVVAVIQRPPGETLTINVDSKGKLSYGL